MPIDPRRHQTQLDTRRCFLADGAGGIGALALGAMLAGEESAQASAASAIVPHFAPRAKRVVCLFQSGGLSHVDLFDNKPTLAKFHGAEIPPDVKGDQRLTGMTSGQSVFPVSRPIAGGKLCGQHQTWISDLLPHTQRIADKIAIVKSMYTEA
ncbi:MAG: DUF1501 domain-containing protein, partial [Planctomycetales bacterium]|nr:DUF1501 domain-containing protein [Planctomycetales bacterium]